MDLNKKPTKNITLWSIILVIFGVISGIAVWILTDRNVLIHEPDKTTPNLQTPAKKPADEQKIKLPGAEPIPVLNEDYTKDSSLLRLVNKSNPLTDSRYKPKVAKPNVAVRADKSPDEQSVRHDIVPKVEELFTAAERAGHKLRIGSGFRDYDLQKLYYTNYSKNYGQAQADKFSAKPGYSEHQTGLVVDVATLDNHCYLESCFGDTPAGKWLEENSYKYGFILRYPKNKKTDFIYEPWHFRYVGKDLARALNQSGLTLDEATPHILKAKAES